MLWPFFTGSSPLPAPWSLGDVVTLRFVWQDDPPLPLLHDFPMQATTLRDDEGEAFAQIVEKDGLIAVRPGHRSEGPVRLSGCLSPPFWASWEQVPPTTAIVRRIQSLDHLYDRGTGAWIARTGSHRLIDLSTTAVAEDDDDIDPGDMEILSPEEYFAQARHLLPETEWQWQGFLISLEVSPWTGGGEVVAERAGGSAG